MSERSYVFRWGSNANAVSRYRLRWKNRTCRVLVRGKMNTCMVRFLDDGELLVTSRNALERVKS